MSKKAYPSKKSIGHREYVNKSMKIIEKDLIFNNLFFSNYISEEKEDGAPEPFSFVITIKKNDRITIRSVSVQGQIATNSDFELKDDNIIFKLKAFVVTLNFLLLIEATGTGGEETTFNLTCDESKVFITDQKIIIENSGRGGYLNKNVAIPLI